MAITSIDYPIIANNIKRALKKRFKSFYPNHSEIVRFWPTPPKQRPNRETVGKLFTDPVETLSADPALMDSILIALPMLNDVLAELRDHFASASGPDNQINGHSDSLKPETKQNGFDLRDAPARDEQPTAPPAAPQEVITKTNETPEPIQSDAIIPEPEPPVTAAEDTIQLWHPDSGKTRTGGLSRLSAGSFIGTSKPDSPEPKAHAHFVEASIAVANIDPQELWQELLGTYVFFAETTNHPSFDDFHKLLSQKTGKPYDKNMLVFELASLKDGLRNEETGKIKPIVNTIRWAISYNDNPDQLFQRKTLAPSDSLLVNPLLSENLADEEAAPATDALTTSASAIVDPQILWDRLLEAHPILARTMSSSIGIADLPDIIYGKTGFRYEMPDLYAALEDLIGGAADPATGIPKPIADHMHAASGINGEIDALFPEFDKTQSQALTSEPPAPVVPAAPDEAIDIRINPQPDTPKKPLHPIRESSGWESSKIELLFKLAAEGLSASQIGRQIGVTRNAVIGKIHRLAQAGHNVRLAGQGATNRVYTRISTPRVAGAKRKKPRTTYPQQIKSGPPTAPTTHHSKEAIAQIYSPLRKTGEGATASYKTVIKRLDGKKEIVELLSNDNPFFDDDPFTAAAKKVCKFTADHPDTGQLMRCTEANTNGSYCDGHHEHLYRAGSRQTKATEKFYTNVARFGYF